MLDALNLIANEEFFFADCIVIGSSKIVSYKLVDSHVQVDENLRVDESDLTDIFQNFSTEIDGSQYAGGEASAHSSCGFFYKKTANKLDWALMSLISDPFVSVERCEGGVCFSSASNVRWVVKNDDIAHAYIDRNK